VAVIEPAKLYREHGEMLFRYLVRMCGDADLAADVLQDTFLRLVERPPRNTEHLKAWLFQVATNRLRDVRRKQTRRDGLMTEEMSRGALADPPVAPDRAVEQAEARTTIQVAMATLSDRDRTILLMREEGFAHREIAEAVGTTTGSVGTLIARALAKLGRALEGESEVPIPRDSHGS
jgi:RNA polymerase sigma-70 factor (ECF subfamily)